MQARQPSTSLLPPFLQTPSAFCLCSSPYLHLVAAVDKLPRSTKTNPPPHPITPDGRSTCRLTPLPSVGQTLVPVRLAAYSAWLIDQDGCVSLSERLQEGAQINCLRFIRPASKPRRARPADSAKSKSVEEHSASLALSRPLPETCPLACTTWSACVTDGQACRILCMARRPSTLSPALSPASSAPATSPPRQACRTLVLGSPPVPTSSPSA